MDSEKVCGLQLCQFMNPSIPRQMNGYHNQPNFASSSSNPYPEFQNVNQYSNNFPIHQQHIPQQQHHPLPQTQWMAPMRSNSIHSQNHQAQQQQQSQRQQPQHHQQQHHQNFNPSMWQNRPTQMPAQPFPTGNVPMAGFNMPFISQQIIQDAFAMSAPVEPADEKILLQALIDSRTKKETYKDALNGLHGVSNLVVAYYSRVLPRLHRRTAIPLVSGRITIWNTRTDWMTGLLFTLTLKGPPCRLSKNLLQLPLRLNTPQ
jgi:hypothetical protein